jgi:hypothetical protein
MVKGNSFNRTYRHGRHKGQGSHEQAKNLNFNSGKSVSVNIFAYLLRILDNLSTTGSSHLLVSILFITFMEVLE